MGAKARALLLCPETPFPPHGGGALRTASLVYGLSRHYAVDLLIFQEPGQPNPRLAAPPGFDGRISVIPLAVHSQHPVPRLGRNLRRAWQGQPPLLDRFSGYEAEAAQLLQGCAYDLAVIEHFWCAPYATLLRQFAKRVVLDLHNIESHLHAGYAATEPLPTRPLHARFSSCYRQLESEWLPRFDVLLATSATDAATLANIAPHTQVVVVPNTIPYHTLPALSSTPSLVFSGNMAYPPNRQAALWFHQKVWPHLLTRHNGLTWRIVGRGGNTLPRRLRHSSGVSVVGPVPDAVTALAESLLAVVPLQSGSGTRLKILEAWAAGLPVVSTAKGAEGLVFQAGETILLADTPLVFENCVSELLVSARKRQEMGQAGRKHYEQHYTWEAAAEAVLVL